MDCWNTVDKALWRNLEISALPNGALAACECQKPLDDRIAAILEWPDSDRQRLYQVLHAAGHRIK